MALDRGTLAKIDRRIFAEFDHAGGVQLVKVPVSDAAWSTWRRYCEAIELTMGEGVAGLITHELRTVVAEVGEGNPVFAERAEWEAEAREERLDAREREFDEREEQLRGAERQLRTLEQRIRAEALHRGPSQSRPKVGRNERCPCGSGLKYKHCHGLAGPRPHGG